VIITSLHCSQSVRKEGKNKVFTQPEKKNCLQYVDTWRGQQQNKEGQVLLKNIQEKVCHRSVNEYFEMYSEKYKKITMKPFFTPNKKLYWKIKNRHWWFWSVIQHILKVLMISCGELYGVWGKLVSKGSCLLKNDKFMKWGSAIPETFINREVKDASIIFMDETHPLISHKWQFLESNSSGGLFVPYQKGN